MPERFESPVYKPETTKLMKDAFDECGRRSDYRERQRADPRPIGERIPRSGACRG